MKRNDIITLKIERLSPDGAGVVEMEGSTIQVWGAIPGDVAEVRIRSLKRHSATGEVLAIQSGAVARIEQSCPHYGLCGGCSWQEIPYETQCALKADIVKNVLAGVPGIGPVGDIPVIPSPEAFRYRNKMEFSFDSPPYSGEIHLGLHEKGKFDRVFDVTGCRIQSELAGELVNMAREFAVERGFTVYGLRSHEGLLRFLVVREGKNTGEVMVNLVTSGEDFPGAEEFAEAVTARFPEVKTITLSINRSPGSTAMAQERRVLVGEGRIRDHIGAFTFTISPDAFFQTNTPQAENLYNTIREFSALTGSEHVLDLYCGTGTIGISLAGGAASVTGVELVEDAVADARRNAILNGVTNASFLAGPVEDLLDERLGQFDVVVCDPPRVGIHPRALSRLVMLRIPRMVYVSCNVKAIPNDLEMLFMAGYRLKEARVLDMAPHTPHIETVLKLEIG